MNLIDALMRNPFKVNKTNKSFNPFGSSDIEEEQELKEIESSIKRNIKIFAEEAKELFSDQRYNRLKSEFKKIYDQNIKLLVYYNEPNGDMNKYAYKMREFQMQLRILEQIFTTPEGFVESEKKINADKS